MGRGRGRSRGQILRVLQGRLPMGIKKKKGLGRRQKGKKSEGRGLEGKVCDHCWLARLTGESVDKQGSGRKLWLVRRLSASLSGISLA